MQYYDPKPVAALMNNLPELESRCRKQGHLGENESLEDLIREDTAEFEALNIDPANICKFFMILKHETGPYAGRKFTLPEFCTKSLDKFESVSHWCLWGKSTFKMQFNGHHFVCYRLTWGGAEQCPIMTFYRSGYAGYSWGSSDWFFNKLDSTGKDMGWLHVPDLLPLQIANYCFCQGKESPCRLSPKTLVEFFGFVPGQQIDYNMETRPQWVFSGWATNRTDATKPELLVHDDTEHSVQVYKSATVPSDGSSPKYTFIQTDEEASPIDYVYMGVSVNLKPANGEQTFRLEDVDIYTGHTLNDALIVTENTDFNIDERGACAIM
jgi:hypothetical protein